ncbi:Ig-like domain-containing protein, partial [Pseudomonas aeruginosa]|nr:Ig-like domain-containing protein [Pseudomonas aeruginosa]
MCDTATVTINLTANVIDAVDDNLSTPAIPAAGGGTTVSVLTNDTFNGVAVVPANLSTTLITAPAGYTIDAAGAISVPANAVAGPVTLGYRICLTAAPTLCDTAAVQLVVGPNAVNDTVSTPGAGQPVSGNVGINDNTPAGSLFTAAGATPTQGSVTVNPDGTFTYQPNAGSAGTDTFGYQVCLPAPNAGVCATATVTVTLGANTLAANDDLFGTPVSGLAGGVTPSVLGNDTLNGAVVTAGTVTATLQGTVAGFTLDAATGVITVAPGTDPGAVTLSYQLCEVAAPANCDVASVQVLISPTAVADSIPLQSGQSETGSVADNDDIVTGVVFTALTQPTQGVLTFAADGSFTYVSNPGSSTNDSFDYQVCLPAPNSGVCSTTTATFVVAANTVDAVDDPFTAPAISPVTGGSTPSVLGNDLFNGVAVNAAQVTVSLINTPPPGYTITSAGVINVPAGAAAGAVSLTMQPNGAFTYTPAGAGTQTAQYQVCLPAPDGATCATGTITFNVIANTLNAVDDNFRAPVLAPGAGGTTPSVLGNDTFNGAAASPLQVTVNLVSSPAGFSIDSDGVITVSGFAPAGATALTYSLCELGSTTNCDTAAVQVLIAPDAQDDAASVTGTQPGTFNLASNDNAPAGSTFTVTAAPTKGTAVLSGDGSLQYTATAGQTGTDTLTYQVCLPAPDGTTCDTAQVTVTLANAALVAVNDDYSASPIPPSGGSTASVLLNDTFNGAAIVPGTTPVTASLLTLESGYSMAANGVISVAAGTPPGSIALNYQVCETALPSNCATATAVVVMSPDAVNDTLPATAGTTTVLNVLANDVAPTTPVVTISVAPVSGTAVVNGDGTISYTPTGPFVGPDTFTYQLCLPAPHGSVCDTATVAVTVSATSLVAVNDSYLATPIAPAAGGSTTSVLLNDTFNGNPIVPGTTPVTATLLSPVTGYTMSTAGVITVAPGTTPAATTLSYQVCENLVPTNCAAATAVVAVSPEAVADALPATAGTTSVLNVLANDTAPLNPVVTITAGPANGTAVANGDGSISYTPTGAFTGTDTFTYQLCLPAPGGSVCDSATVTVTVSATSLVAANDDFTATPITPVAGGSTASVLLNDTFSGAPIIPGTTAVAASLITPPTGYSMTADGVITVAPGTTPAAVTLNYQVCENAVPTNCAGATALVAVSPEAVADALPAAAGTTTVLNVLANDTAPLNPTVTVSVAPTNGTAIVNGDGTISYTPTGAFTGTDTFTYQLCLPAPGAAVCDTATVTVTVAATTLAAANDDFTATPIAPAAGGSTASVLLNDTFNGAAIVPGTTAVTATLLTTETGYSMAADGVITVAPGTTPAAVPLNYQVCENAVPTNCAAASAVVAVSPVAVDDNLPATAGAATVLNVTTNDTLPANPTITVSVAPTNGTTTVNGDGTISYTPTAGFTGADSFTYQVCLPAPGASVCDTATVSLTVSATSLVATNDDFTATPIPPAAGGSTTSVLLNDTFNGVAIVPGTTAVTASLLTPPTGYSMSATGVITVAPGTTPAAVTLNYQVCENASPTNCAAATAVVAVSPDAVVDALPATAGTTTVLNVLANDTAPLNPTVTVSVAPTNGTAVVNPDGTISYTPTGAFTGTDTFTYQLCLPAPGASVCDTATVTVTVSATTLTALNDDFTGTPIAPAAGGSTTSVLLNDTFNGATIVPGTTPVTASLLTTVPGYSMDASGVITVAPGTTPAAVTLNYQVCENAVPTNCAGASAVVAVSPVAAADTLTATAGTTSVLNVLANDT